MAEDAPPSPEGRSSFVARGGKPPAALLLVLFGVPAALILVFAVLLGLKIFRPPQPVVLQDDRKIEEEINDLLDESWALIGKAHQAGLADDPIAKLLIDEAKRKAERLSEMYGKLLRNPEYVDADGSLKRGYEWIGALGGRVAEIVIASRDL